MTIPTAATRLFQGSRVTLVLHKPTRNGEAADFISQPRFFLFDPEDVEVIDKAASFDSGVPELTVLLDDSETVDLLGRYYYEFWEVDLQNNPFLIQSGYLEFLATLARF